MGAIDERSRTRIESELAPPERLLWSGRPIPGSGEDRRLLVILGLTLIGLAAGAAVYYLMWLMTADFGDDFLRNVAGGFYGAAIYFAVLLGAGNALERCFRARRVGTLFALTDRRAIVWHPGRSRGGVEVYSFPLGSLDSVHRLEKPDGSGDLAFLPVVERPFGPPRGFTRVADVASLDALFREAMGSSMIGRLREPDDAADGGAPIPKEAGAIDPDFDEVVLGQIKPELAGDEQLLWVGRPPLSSPGDELLTRTLGIALFVLLGGWIVTYALSRRFGGKAGAWGIVSAALLGTASFSALFLALGFVCDRLTRATRRKTLYAVTDRRAILWRPEGDRGGVKVHSVEGRSIAGTERIDYPDGTGDLLILGETGRAEDYRLRFVRVVDVARVERLLREMAYSAAPRRGWTSASR